jgi:hypothetical protein
MLCGLRTVVDRRRQHSPAPRATSSSPINGAHGSSALWALCCAHTWPPVEELLRFTLHLAKKRGNYRHAYGRQTWFHAGSARRAFFPTSRDFYTICPVGSPRPKPRPSHATAHDVCNAAQTTGEKSCKLAANGPVSPPVNLPHFSGFRRRTCDASLAHPLH